MLKNLSFFNILILYVKILRNFNTNYRVIRWLLFIFLYFFITARHSLIVKYLYLYIFFKRLINALVLIFAFLKLFLIALACFYMLFYFSDYHLPYFSDYHLPFWTYFNHHYSLNFSISAFVSS